jgi:transcription antitermination factor NusG
LTPTDERSTRAPDIPPRAICQIGADEPIIKCQPCRVLLVNPRHASIVTRDLEAKGCKVYLPTFKETRKWHDRKVELDIPLFRGYVFSWFDFDERVEVLQTFGVVRILSCLGVPAVVTEAEIVTIQEMLASGLPCSSSALAIGQKVEIICGPLVGKIGILKKFKGKDQWGLIVNIEMLGRGVSVTINREWARAISK